jgi:hypothetical protein
MTFCPGPASERGACFVESGAARLAARPDAKVAKPHKGRELEMTASSASCVLRVLLALPSLTHGLDGAARRWRRLTASLFDPYRPERHYMRGPGPKWREKHAGEAGR